MQAYDPADLQGTATDDSIDPVDVLEFDEKTGKRATHENFNFRPLGDGHVEVENASHADPDEHTYVVDIEQGIPFACSCPADEYHDGACKHRVAVALARPVIDAAGGQESQLATDGGVIEAGDEGEILEGDDEPEQDYTYHYEPPAQGGARYVRCEHCGAESVPAKPERVLHREGCPLGDRR